VVVEQAIVEQISVVVVVEKRTVDFVEQTVAVAGGYFWIALVHWNDVDVVEHRLGLIVGVELEPK
jgi:hypothetical protein